MRRPTDALGFIFTDAHLVGPGEGVASGVGTVAALIGGCWKQACDAIVGAFGQLGKNTL